MHRAPIQRMPTQVHPQQSMGNVNQQQLTQMQAAAQQLQPRAYPDTIVGRAKTQLERQIFNAIEICQQIDGKLKTLMNSNAYKTASKKTDIKELYIHLSYLFTYTNDRFKTVQEKCMDDMRQMGFKKDAGTLSSGNVVEKYGSDIENDEEIEIVEPNHATINLDSDEERTPKKKTPSKGAGPLPAKKTPTSATAANTVEASSVAEVSAAEPISDSVPEVQTENITSTSDVIRGNNADEQDPDEQESLEVAVDISAMLSVDFGDDDGDDGDDGTEQLNEAEESLLMRMNDEVEEIGTPPPMEDSVDKDIADDAKLNAKARVLLNRAESEYPDKIEKSFFDPKAADSSVESTVNDSNADGSQKEESPGLGDSAPSAKKPIQMDYYENDVVSIGSDDEDNVVETSVPAGASDEAGKTMDASDDALFKSALDNVDAAEPTETPSVLLEDDDDGENSLLEIQPDKQEDGMEVDEDLVDSSTTAEDEQSKSNENEPGDDAEPAEGSTAVSEVADGDEDGENALLEIQQDEQEDGMEMDESVVDSSMTIENLADDDICAIVECEVGVSDEPAESEPLHDAYDGIAPNAVAEVTIAANTTDELSESGDETAVQNEIAAGADAEAKVQLDANNEVEPASEMAANAEVVAEIDDLESLDRIIEEAGNAIIADTLNTDSVDSSQQCADGEEDVVDEDALLNAEELENISSPDTFNEYAKNGGSPRELLDGLDDFIVDNYVNIPATD